MKPRIKDPVGKLVKVEWLDITSHVEWHTQPEAEHMPAANCWTVGLMLKGDELVIRLASSGNDTKGDVSNIDVIPRGAVLRIKELITG